VLGDSGGAWACCITIFCIVKVATPPGGDCSSNSTAGRTGGDTTFQPVMRLAQPAVMPLFNRR